MPRLPALRTVNRKGQTHRDRLAEGEAILRDRALGLQVSELCSKYDVSVPTLYRRIDDALKARVAPTVDAYREEQNALLDELMHRWEQQAQAAGIMIHEGTVSESHALVDRGMTKHAEALNGMLRVSERRAKLNGLDAPAKAEVTVTMTTPIDDAVAALVAEVERAAS